MKGGSSHHNEVLPLESFEIEPEIEAIVEIRLRVLIKLLLGAGFTGRYNYANDPSVEYASYELSDLRVRLISSHMLYALSKNVVLMEIEFPSPTRRVYSQGVCCLSFSSLNYETELNRLTVGLL